MANVNKTILVGRLVRDPEIKELPSGSLVANLTLAVSKKIKSKTGEEKQDTLFIDIVGWNRQAELIQEYLVKGQETYVEGHLELDQWEAEDECPSCRHVKKVKRQKHRMVLDHFQFLGPLKKEEGNDDNYDRSRNYRDDRRDDRRDSRRDDRPRR